MKTFNKFISGSLIFITAAGLCACKQKTPSVNVNNTKAAAINQTAKEETDINSINEENNTQIQEEEDGEENIPKYIKEIRKLFESGKYNIENYDDLQKIADKLNEKQLIELAGDIRDCFSDEHVCYPSAYLPNMEQIDYKEKEKYIKDHIPNYGLGLGIPEPALFFYIKAAEKGNTEMQYKLAELYIKDYWYYVTHYNYKLPSFFYWINSKTGKNWLQLAYENNYPDAVKDIVEYCLPYDYYSCGYEFMGGKSDLVDFISESMPLDATHCSKYIENAFKQNLAKPYHLAKHYYYNAKDYKKTLKYINESFEYFKTHQSKDDKYWQSIMYFITGDMYYYGYEYPQDYKKALEYYQKGLDSYIFDGFIRTNSILAISYMYKHDLVLKQDIKHVKKYIIDIDVCKCLRNAEELFHAEEYKDLCVSTGLNK